MMSREKELLKNTVILSLGRFLPRLVAIVVLPIMTAYLTKTEYGTYDLVATLVMLLLPVATLQIQSAAFRFLIDCRGNKERSSQIISNIFVVTLPISIAVASGLAVYMTNLSGKVRFGIALYLIADILYMTITQIARGLSYNIIYSIGSILYSVINGIGVVVSLKFMHEGLFGVIISLGLANLIAGIFVGACVHLHNYLNFSFISRSVILDMISYSWPMIPNNLSNWVLKLSDRLIITAALGVEANAVYAVANKIPNLLAVAQSVFVMAWQENASIAVGDKDVDKYYTRMFEQIFSLLLGFTAVLIGLTPVMFHVLIKGDYDDAYMQIPILILGMFFYCMSAFQGGIYIAHKKTKSVGVTTIAAAGVNLAIDVLFVNVWGITAGSVSTLIAYLFLYVFRMFDSLKFQPMDYKLGKQVLMLMVICIMLYLCFLRNIYFDVLNFVLGVVWFTVFNRRMLMIVLKKLLQRTHIQL